MIRIITFAKMTRMNENRNELQIDWKIERGLNLDNRRPAAVPPFFIFCSSMLGSGGRFWLIRPSSSSSSDELEAESRKVRPFVFRTEATVGGEDGCLRGRSRAEVMVTISVIVNSTRTIRIAV
jgi:hypothetical protein